MKKWIKDNWWWSLLIVILFICVVLVLWCPSYIEKTKTIIQLYSEFISPTAIVLGLVLGYPLLKRKLIDGHITKQFEIINEANRKVRNEALRLKAKYPIRQDFTPLSKEYLTSVYEDVRSLNELSLDGNPILYKYTELMRRALYLYIEEYDKHIGERGVVQDNGSAYIINCDTIMAWMQHHLVTIYNYARSMQEVPTGNTKKCQYEKGDVSKYLTENTFYEVESLDPSISYYYNSQYLMKYQENNNKSLSDRDWLFFKYCYSSVRTTKAMARMMYKDRVYLPLVLSRGTGEIFNETLCLVGYKKSDVINLSTWQTIDSYVCFYASIGVLDNTSIIKKSEDLNGFIDTYIGRGFDMTMYEVIDSKHRMIQVEMRIDKAKKNYKIVKKKLIANMKKEMKV